MKMLLPFFDSLDFVLHGLVHVRDDDTTPSECPGCFSRTSHGKFGPWIA